MQPPAVHHFQLRTGLFAALLSFALPAHAQHSCADLRSGDYYYYPRNTLQQYHIVLTGDREKVVDMNKRKGAPYHDSSVYKIEWKGDCEYFLKYVEGSGLSDDDLKFVSKHRLYYHVDSIGPDYYLFISYVDRPSSGQALGKDTMWLHPQTHSAGNMIFGLTDPARVRKIHFTDTSRMALLYIYRPGKLKLSFTPLTIFYNDLPIDLRFGKTYYIRADMIWGLYKTGNTKLGFTVMDPAQGKPEFDEIYAPQ